MCGIAGIVSKTERIDLFQIKKVNNFKIYRGPDDEGYFGNVNFFVSPLL